MELVFGCGSMFIRYFNFKGYLRLYNDEWLFKCFYEGCFKGIFCWFFVYNFLLIVFCLVIVGFVR